MKKKIPCKTCGKLFVPCVDCAREFGYSAWRAVACSPACGEAYFEAVARARNQQTIKEQVEVISQPRKKRSKKVVSDEEI